MKKKNFIIDIIICLVLFVGFLSFYTVSHPLYIYDTDDWTYIGVPRQALPAISEWNPTKVLPETLMPLVAQLGVQFIMPISGDYIGSMAIAYAICLSAFITVYLYSFYKLFIVIGKLERKSAVILELFLVLMQFFVFKSHYLYFFYGINLTVVFNYIIAGLLNATVVIYWIQKEKIKLSDVPLKRGIFLLIIYLAINSNMLHSIILVSYLGSTMLISCLQEVRSGLKAKERHNIVSVFKKFFSNNFFQCGIIIVWLISIYMESQGRRAQYAPGVGLRDLPIRMTIGKFIESLFSVNWGFWLCMLGGSVAAILICLLNRKKKNWESEIESRLVSILGCAGLALAITIVYLLLLCAKVAPDYIKRSEVMMSWLFWIFLSGFCSWAYLLNRFRLAGYIMPLLLYWLIFETVVHNGVYADTNVSGFSPEIVKALDDNIVRQVVEAEKAGKNTVEVSVPVHDSDGWPLATSYGGDRIAYSLYEHGIIQKRIQVILVPDEKINEEYHLE